MKCGKPFCACVGTCFAMHSPLRDEAPVHQEPVACKNLCELCEKRGYIYCANAAKTTPLPLAPVQQEKQK